MKLIPFLESLILLSFPVFQSTFVLLPWLGILARVFLHCSLEGLAHQLTAHLVTRSVPPSMSTRSHQFPWLGSLGLERLPSQLAVAVAKARVCSLSVLNSAAEFETFEEDLVVDEERASDDDFRPDLVGCVRDCLPGCEGVMYVDLGGNLSHGWQRRRGGGGRAGLLRATFLFPLAAVS